MRKMMLSTALVLVAVLVLSVIAAAQPGGGGRGQRGPGGFGGPGGGGGAGIGMLLRNDDVKAQVGLSEDQIQKIEKIFEEGRANRPQRDPNAGRPSAEEMERMRADAEKRRQESQDKIRQILSPEQQEKVKVLGFQISGGLSSPMLSADSLEVLNLTPDQKAKLKAILDERDAARRANFADMPGRDAPQEERQKFFEQARAKGEELQKATEAKIQAILTADQKAKADQLTESGRELREKVQQQMRQGGPGGNRGGQGAAAGEGGAYQPGQNSWRPGQGAGNQQQGEGNRRRNFPRATENQ